MTREECKRILMEEKDLSEERAEKEILETERVFEQQSERLKTLCPLSSDYKALTNMEFPR